MGFYLTKIGDKKLKDYFGSQTMYSCAANGAFDSEVSEELEDIANEDDGIYAIVDKDGVQHFLKTLKSGHVHGRDVKLLIKTVEENYQDGFTVRG